jgi:hypothetical protein
VLDKTPAEALEKLIMRGLAREKADRPKTMREVAEAFAPYADASFTLWLRDSALSKAVVVARARASSGWRASCRLKWRVASPARWWLRPSSPS